jgi:hypothetical protein
MENFTGGQFLFVLIMAIIGMAIWYVLIKGAVSAANKPLEEKLDRLIELKEAEKNHATEQA